ncbi:hypothetical protein JW948_04515 [bacterium]|nr:hypothetical protein [bacterium]
MKHLKWNMLAIAVTVFVYAGLQAQSSGLKKIAILPVQSIGVDEVSTQTAESILRMEMEGRNVFDIVPDSQIRMKAPEGCAEAACAVQAGKALNADQVLLCKLAALGEKIIVQYQVLDVASGNSIIQDRLTSTTVEDLDEVMKRVAMGAAQAKTADQTAEVGVITDKETQESRRRGSHLIKTYAIGYLFPEKGYGTDERSLSLDFRTGAETDVFEMGMESFIRKGFGVNVYVARLLSRGDVCPYAGVAFGFHWVQVKDMFDDDDKRKEDGFELIFNTGTKLFHTYNFNLQFNLAYMMTFNDFNSRGLVFTVGISK